MPDITAVLMLKDKPAGSAPVTDQVNGAAPPEAASDTEYGTPPVPSGKDDVVMFKGGTTTIIRSFSVCHC
jgi:hypothetical protein